MIFDPGWNLEELAELEERAWAHLDGLRIGAEHSVDISRPALAGDEKGAATAAALTLMAVGSPERETEVVLALAAAASPLARDGIRIGLRHSDVSRVADRLTNMASAGEPAVRAAAADLLAFHRLAAPPRLIELKTSPDAEIRRLAYGAVGRFGGPWSIDDLDSALSSDDGRLRAQALETSARLAVPDLAALCRRAAARQPSGIPDALMFLGILGDPQDLPLMEAAVRRPNLATAAIAAMGALGSIRAIPLLLEIMKDSGLARAAGAAFVRITAADGIAADRPPPTPAGLSEDERDFLDETKPPDPDKARAAWEEVKSGFAAEGRWQCGREVSREPLGEGFNSLSLQTRRDLYLSVRARDAGRTRDLELEASAVRQRGRP